MKSATSGSAHIEPSVCIFNAWWILQGPCLRHIPPPLRLNDLAQQQRRPDSQQGSSVCLRLFLRSVGWQPIDPLQVSDCRRSALARASLLSRLACFFLGSPTSSLSISNASSPPGRCERATCSAGARATPRPPLACQPCSSWMTNLFIPIFIIKRKCPEASRPRFVLAPITRDRSATIFVDQKASAQLLQPFSSSLIVCKDDQMPAFWPLHHQALDGLLIQL